MKVVSESRSRPALVGHRLALEVAGLPSFIKFLPPHQVNDELFFVEQDRKVNADNTFSLKAIRFEAPRDLRSKTIQVRFSRSNFEQAIVYYLSLIHI